MIDGVQGTDRGGYVKSNLFDFSSGFVHRGESNEFDFTEIPDEAVED